MRINFWIPHTRVSGGVIVILHYARELSLLGHEVTLIVESPRLIRRVVSNTLKYVPHWMRQFGTFSIRKVKSFTYEEAYTDADVVIADSWRCASYLTFVSKHIQKIHFIQHDERMYHGDRDLVDAVYRLPIQKIVVSTWIKDMFKRDYQYVPHVILNTVDRRIFNPKHAENGENIRILVLDHTYAWKGTKDAIDIVHNLKKNIDKPITLVGFGSRREHAEFLYDEYHYGVSHSQLADLYSSCDVYLCTSSDEGFGLPSLEAMACGAALATYDNGGSRDFAIHNKTALVAPRLDKEALQEQLQTLVLNETIRRDVAAAGLQFVETLPTWAKQTKKLVSFLESVHKC